MTNLPKMVKEHTEGCAQNHPFHCFDVWGHIEVVSNCLHGQSGEDYDLYKVGLLHDVGKPNVKSTNPKTGYDQFLNHAQASVAWVEAHGIEISELEKDLILEHDNAKGWVNGKKLAMYCTKHGERFAELLALVIEADAQGQAEEVRSANIDIISKIRNGF